MSRAVLPEGLARYRTIGPFDPQTLPAGLRAEHRLKPDVWALLSVRRGSLRFVWDDGRADRLDMLVAGDVIAVPPEVLHHVEADGDFEIEIDFLR